MKAQDWLFKVPSASPEHFSTGPFLKMYLDPRQKRCPRLLSRAQKAVILIRSTNIYHIIIYIYTRIYIYICMYGYVYIYIYLYKLCELPYFWAPGRSSYELPGIPVRQPAQEQPPFGCSCKLGGLFRGCPSNNRPAIRGL